MASGRNNGAAQGHEKQRLGCQHGKIPPVWPCLIGKTSEHDDKPAKFWANPMFKQTDLPSIIVTLSSSSSSILLYIVKTKGNSKTSNYERHHFHQWCRRQEHGFAIETNLQVPPSHFLVDAVFRLLPATPTTNNQQTKNTGHHKCLDEREPITTWTSLF